ncbi:MAG: hypothetical protein ACRCWP_03625 [Shewanella sp.]
MKNIHIHLELQRYTDGLAPDWQRAEGPDGCQNYCFRYVDLHGKPREKMLLTPDDFHPNGVYQPCSITLHLRPKKGLTAKFRWLNARSFVNEGISTKGQRMSMLHWQEQQVTFAVDQKLAADYNVDSQNKIELDVWIGGLGEKLGEEELMINCDPKIEIQQ